MFDTVIEMLSYPFMTRAFLVGSLVALCSALLGVSLVLKRYSMIGDGLSHVGFGGGAQSTAGGVKVNAFAVVVLNLVAVLRGSERVEVFGRELSHDSIRRSNATVVMSLGVLFLFIFILSILEPQASLMALTFECVSALSTVGSSLNLTPNLCDASKLLVALLMFIGRVGLITLMLGIIKQKKNTKYRYPSDNIIIN